MKTKTLKKILAAMLAASSVMSMAGTAMAVKEAPRSQKSQEVSNGSDGKKAKRNGKKAKRKRRKFVTIKKNAEKVEKNLQLSECESIHSIPFLCESPIITPRRCMLVPSDKRDTYNGNGDSMMSYMLDSTDISSEDCLDNRCIVYITDQIKSFKLNGNLNNLKKCSMDKRVRLVNGLVKWMTSTARFVDRQVNAMVAIVDLAESEFFDGFDNKQKLDILRALVTCSDSCHVGGPSVAWAFRHLDKAGFIAGNESSEEVLKLQKVLKDFEKYADDEPDIGVDYYFDNIHLNGNGRGDELNFFNDDEDDYDIRSALGKDLFKDSGNDSGI